MILTSARLPAESTRTAKTTSSGLAYTEIVLSLANPVTGEPDPVVVAVSVNRSSTLLLTAHGHNGSEQTINRTEFAATLDRAIASGWVVVASHAAGNGWGNDASQAGHVAAWQWARANLGTQRTVLHGQSMGAQILANVLSRGTVTDQVCLVTIDGALNLAAAYASSSYAEAIRTAYGIAADGSDYATKTSGYDASLRPPATFTGTSMLIEASPADTAIPKAQHSDVFAANIAGFPAQLVRVTGTGQHVSAENYVPGDVHRFVVPKVTRTAYLLGAHPNNSPASPLMKAVARTTDGWAPAQSFLLG